MHQKSESPYQNLSLQDIDGEIWRGVVGLEDYYEISNYGRLKSLPRYVERIMGKNGLIRYNTREKMRKQNILKIYNRSLKLYSFSLSCSVSVIEYHIRSRIIIAREVYKAFIGKIPEGMYVLHNDNDAFNNSVENLYLSTPRELILKIIRENRSHALAKFRSYDWTPERLKKRAAKAANKIVVSQFDIQGNFLSTYSSIQEAEQATGISHGHISTCIYNKAYTAGGYIWIKGKYQKNLYVKVFGARTLISKNAKAKWLKPRKYPHDNTRLSSLKGEIWKSVKGYEDWFEVSSLGRVKLCPRMIKNAKGEIKWTKVEIYRPRQRILDIAKKQQTASSTLVILHNRKRLVIARLVYQAFVGDLPKRQCVFHKDGDSFNNCADNLYLPVKLTVNKTNPLYDSKT